MPLFPGATLFPSPALYPGRGLFPHTGQAWRFTPPVLERPFRLAGRGLIGTSSWGVSVWRDATGWHTGTSVPAEVRAAADRFYEGGHVHHITSDEADELDAAGFGSYLQEDL